jgi:threonine dehydrogenase-like Zn-dependent dehydrogenase
MESRRACATIRQAGEMTAAAAWLLSDDAAFCCGTELLTPQSTVWPIALYDIFRRELTIKGSFAQQFSFDRALSALRNGRVKTEGMISKRFTLDAYDEALAAVADSSVVKALIVP